MFYFPIKRLKYCHFIKLAFFLSLHILAVPVVSSLDTDILSCIDYTAVSFIRNVDSRLTIL